MPRPGFLMHPSRLCLGNDNSWGESPKRAVSFRGRPAPCGP